MENLFQQGLGAGAVTIVFELMTGNPQGKHLGQGQKGPAFAQADQLRCSQHGCTSPRLQSAACINSVHY